MSRSVAARGSSILQDMNLERKPLQVSMELHWEPACVSARAWGLSDLENQGLKKVTSVGSLYKWQKTNKSVQEAIGAQLH